MLVSCSSLIVSFFSLARSNTVLCGRYIQYRRRDGGGSGKGGGGGDGREEEGEVGREEEEVEGNI